MKKINLLFILTVYISTVNANITLPKLFSNNMVLQRNVLIPIWGWASPNEKILVKFHNQSQKTVADPNGNWMVKLKPEKAGGPFQLEISGANAIKITNILVGEVWLCSGQSNMEWLVRNSLNAREEIKSAGNYNIRYLKIERDINSLPENDIKSSKWDICDSGTVKDFGAVAYFFAQNLYKEIKVPIGLINSSWGGTNIETWISREGFESSNEFRDMIARMPKISLDSLNNFIIASQIKKIEGIEKVKLNSFDETTFKDQHFDDSKLPTLYQPKAWEQQSLGEFDGVVWIRKTIELTEEDSKKSATIYLSKIDDEDITFINGIQVGSTSAWNVERKYILPAGILQKGKNVIIVKITDGGGGGGMYGNSENVRLDLGNTSISLSGDWKFQVENIKLSSEPNQFPSLCYNAMIQPLIPFAFKGVLWYQGEGNVERAFQYKKAFPLLIQDWRKKWGNTFPFYYVQLATYETPGNSNEGSPWAELREAQTLTLQVPKTGMVVTTDIGDPKDIHPINKQAVGKRLANMALNNDYNKPNSYKSPMFKSMKITGNQAIVIFENPNSTLTTLNKNEELKGFEMAGNDKIFHPAKGIIKGNQVILKSTEVTDPVAVRFGWKSDDSDCNLFNAEGLPVVPFRTDNWKSITTNEKYTILK